MPIPNERCPFRNQKESVDVFLQLSDNGAAGGTCFGDSGGANFSGSENVIAAVNSFVVNSQCAGWSGGYRIDQADDPDFIMRFLD